MLSDRGKSYPQFSTVPKWWMENDIHKAHSNYLANLAGIVSRTTPAPTTRSVASIAEWKERWDVLGILPTE